MEQAASENYRQAQEGATRSAREIETVAEYLRDMQGGEDAQTALNGLVSQLFVQSQQEWMRQNPDADLDEAMQRFADALKRYRRLCRGQKRRQEHGAELRRGPAAGAGGTHRGRSRGAVSD